MWAIESAELRQVARSRQGTDVMISDIEDRLAIRDLVSLRLGG